MKPDSPFLAYAIAHGKAEGRFDELNANGKETSRGRREALGGTSFKA